MADLNSWEDDPAAQDEGLSRQTEQQLNVNSQHAAQGQGTFRPNVASFQPTAQTFQPGQGFGAGFVPQFQQQQYYQQGFYPQYGQQQGFTQYNQGYGGGFSQGYNQSYGQLASRMPMRASVNPAYQRFQAVAFPSTVSSPVSKPSKPSKPRKPRNPSNLRLPWHL